MERCTDYKTRCPLYPPDESAKQCGFMLSPVSHKGSVAHQAFQPLQSSPCRLYMSVAQAQASKSPHPLSTAERRCAARGWPRESEHKAHEALRTAPCRGLWAVAHAVGTCVRRRRLCRPPSLSRRPATQPLHPAPDSTRAADAWALVRCATRRALRRPFYSSATSLRLASVSPSM